MPSRWSERSSQRRNARRIKRSIAQLDRLDRRHQRRRGGHNTGRAVLSVVLSAALLLTLVAFYPSDDMVALRRLIGIGNDRVDAAPTVPDGEGSFAFVQTQPQTGEPVGYDPCRVIQVEVNLAGAPDDYDDLVDTAIAHTSGATGLHFERVGLTDRRPSKRATLQRQPVLVAWATADEVPDLDGDVAGIGGSTAVDLGLRNRRFITGTVVLDSSVFDDLQDGGQAEAQAIVDHEFGHLVGLDHVHDRGELMNEDNVGRTSYGPGDLEGLARLGSIPC